MSTADWLAALGWFVSVLGAYYLGLAGADRQRRIALADSVRTRLQARRSFAQPALGQYAAELHELLRITPRLQRGRLRRALAAYEAAERDTGRASTGQVTVRDPARVEQAHAELLRVLR